MSDTTLSAPDSPMGIVIREATIGDSATLLELVDALADYERLPRPTADARVRLIRDGFGEKRRFRPYLAELDGQAAAYAITLETYSSFLAQPTLFLEDLFVLPTARKRGVGSAIFRFLAREAVKRDCGRMEWFVLEWNELAIDFYEALGARRLDEWYAYRLTRNQLEEIAGDGRT
jgi:GNAT superfamily N-acetyltransferase